MSGDVLTMIGTVVEVRRGGVFVVECAAGAFRRTVLARISGRMHMHRVRVVAGDDVTVEVSVYDTTRGRIVYRGRGEEHAR